MIHTVKGFSIITETEVDVFLEFFSFLYDLVNVGNIMSGFLPFLNQLGYLDVLSSDNAKV